VYHFLKRQDVEALVRNIFLGFAFMSRHHQEGDRYGRGITPTNA
jgi:hypothetical protein